MVSEVGVPSELDELFFICGRSKMSRTEKLEERGILISSNLKREKNWSKHNADKLGFIYYPKGRRKISKFGKGGSEKLKEWDILISGNLKGKKVLSN